MVYQIKRTTLREGPILKKVYTGKCADLQPGGKCLYFGAREQNNTNQLIRWPGSLDKKVAYAAVSGN